MVYVILTDGGTKQWVVVEMGVSIVEDDLIGYTVQETVIRS